MSKIINVLTATKVRVGEFFSKREKGESTLITTLLFVIIAVGLCVIFKGKIESLIETVWTNIETMVTGFGTAGN